ncbi:hypothetical protein, variant [Saprolegnia diclina VS20]|uniref:Ubiquitin carboxyl-terminal hydrolase n=1 Tax=Saprolegnia diclina (strain VS20) TaxID=1156394 RepID=T0Q4T5_SAPDV|nr:hypothetical protein, variant [Saprolegnia diclina VS20]EQC32844.1 hypothetical protein, variant [Saprolegnia diclina VS20]|eukprot:XP_008613530.1 hypothetical protein, variant [Saprolegnia diclina VS20]
MVEVDAPAMPDVAMTKAQKKKNRKKAKKKDDESAQDAPEAPEPATEPPVYRMERPAVSELRVPTAKEAPIPSPAQQKDIVHSLMLQSKQHGMKVGEKFFVVNYKWWECWCDYVGYLAKGGASRPLPSSKPPTISNSSLLDPACDQMDHVVGSALLPGLVEHSDYFLVPSEVWSALTVWYAGGPPICRFVVGVGEPSSPQYFTRVEVYPETAGDSDVEMDVESSSSPPTPTPTSKCTVCGRPSRNRCAVCKTPYYCSKQCQSAHWKYHKSVCRVIKGGGSISAVETHGRRGQTGLRNLGNTCFMNAALQCLSHTPVLTAHFLTNLYQADLNTDNVLGTGGQLATEYAVLLKDLWFGAASSVTPAALKRSLARYAPQFSGYQQHDAQELLAYLLDGLHEDVNRIQKKPYIEIQESNGSQPDAVISDQAWHNHCLRNQSIFVEQLQGQFKSTVVCPTCDRISITFDPFNVIQLELPTDANRHFDVLSVPFFTKASYAEESREHLGPTHYRPSVPKRGTVAQLKKALAGMGCTKTQHVLCDVFQSMVYRVLQDAERVARIRSDDRLVCYDVPLGSAVVFCYHRKASGQLFGDPILLSYTAATTCEELVRNLTYQVWPLVAPAVLQVPEGKKAHVELLKLLAKHVYLANQDGANVPGAVSLDDWSAFLPSASVASLGLGDCAYFGIDWTDDLVYQEPEMDVHASAQLAKVAKADGISLDSCFKKFTSPEELDEDNLWYCSQCKEHRQATKTMQLYKLPNILILSLKRFEYRNEVVREKLDIMVDFPLEGLDMGPYCLSAQDGMVYDLYAVTNHYGSMGFGHYTAYAKDSEHNLWYTFDDSSVTPVSASQTVSNAAYILFYKRREL